MSNDKDLEWVDSECSNPACKKVVKKHPAMVAVFCSLDCLAMAGMAVLTAPRPAKDLLEALDEGAPED